MRIGVRSKTLIFTLPAVILFMAQTCLACDCLTLSAAESLKGADLVFIGKVISTNTSGSETAVTFQAAQVLKGTEKDAVVVTSKMTDCDFAFHKGYTYIVYARRVEDQFIASSCTATKALNGYVEQHQSFIRHTPTPHYGYKAIVPGVILLLALVIGYVAGRSRTRAAW